MEEASSSRPESRPDTSAPGRGNSRVKLSLDDVSNGSVQPFASRLRKRITQNVSYEELSDLDSDDDKGSAHRKKVGCFEYKFSGRLCQLYL